MAELARKISPSKMLGRANLSDLEKRVIRLRYGIGAVRRTWHQIQAELGISRVEARQLECRALRLLRHLG